MRGALRWFVVVVTGTRGLIRLLGVAKGFGWAEVAELEGPTGAAGGAVWLVPTMLVVATGLLLAVRSRWWWRVGAIAVTISEIAIVTAWSDAWAGAGANVVLLAAAVYGFTAHGPAGGSAEYRRLVRNALDDPPAPELVTDGDLAGLPAPVARCVRRSGAVGQPRVANFRAHIHGRIRAAADAPWKAILPALLPFVVSSKWIVETLS